MNHNSETHHRNNVFTATNTVMSENGPTDTTRRMGGDNDPRYASYHPNMLSRQTFRGTLEFHLTMEEWDAEMARRERDFPQGHPMRRSPFDPRHGMGMMQDNVGYTNPHITRSAARDTFPSPHHQHPFGPRPQHPHFHNGHSMASFQRDVIADRNEQQRRHMMRMMAERDMRHRSISPDMMMAGGNMHRGHHRQHQDLSYVRTTTIRNVGTQGGIAPRAPVARVGGYQTSWVVDASQIRGDMMCCMCDSIMYNPLTLGECGHSCCGRCLNNVDTGLPLTTCPQCNVPTGRAFSFNSTMAGEIDHLAAKCPRCAFTGTLHQVREHERSCTARGPISDVQRATEWLQGQLPPNAPPITPEMRAAAARLTASPQVVDWFATLLGQAHLDTLPPLQPTEPDTPVSD